MRQEVKDLRERLKKDEFHDELRALSPEELSYVLMENTHKLEIWVDEELWRSKQQESRELQQAVNKLVTVGAVMIVAFLAMAFLTPRFLEIELAGAIVSVGAIVFLVATVCLLLSPKSRACWREQEILNFAGRNKG